MKWLIILILLVAIITFSIIWCAQARRPSLLPPPGRRSNSNAKIYSDTQCTNETKKKPKLGEYYKTKDEGCKKITEDTNFSTEAQRGVLIDTSTFSESDCWGAGTLTAPFCFGDKCCDAPNGAAAPRCCGNGPFGGRCNCEEPSGEYGCNWILSHWSNLCNDSNHTCGC